MVLCCCDKSYIYLRCTAWGFGIHVHHERMATVMLTNVPLSTHGHWLARRQWQELEATLTASHLPPNTQYLKLTWCAHHWTFGLFVLCHCNRVCSDQHLPVPSSVVTILLCHHALPPTCKGIHAGNSPVVLWPLSYFRWDSALKVYPSFYKWPSLLFLKGRTEL